MDESLKSTPKSIDMIVLLADFYIQNNLIDQAIEVINSALGKTKEHIKGYIKLIEAYLIKGDDANARRVISIAKEIDPENEEIKKIEKNLERKPEVEYSIRENIDVEIVEEKIEEKEEKGINAIKLLLKEFNEKNEEILGSLLIDETGILIAEEIKVPIDVEGTSAMISSVQTEVDEAVKKINFGLIEYIFFDFPKGRLLLLSSKPILFIALASKNIETGLLLMLSKETFEKIKKKLEL